VPALPLGVPCYVVTVHIPPRRQDSARRRRQTDAGGSPLPSARLVMQYRMGMAQAVLVLDAEVRPSVMPSECGSDSYIPLLGSQLIYSEGL
jgi:hypothetical protein